MPGGSHAFATIRGREGGRVEGGEAAAGTGAVTSREAWFSARRESDGRVVIEGQSEARLGTPVEREDGTTDGIWAAWRWDGRQLSVRNDRYGIYPLFYSATPDRILLSPSVATLLALGAPRDLDDDAL